ncbi:hypothetical protein Q5690_30655, partial [Microcoleus sp. F10-D1]|uniref:hypothetical protein n=1 Tax=unclassified Microcoleus TaxID=2642155 RepID=UPI002FD2E532
SLKVFGFQVFTTDKEIRPTSAECGIQGTRHCRVLILANNSDATGNPMKKSPLKNPVSCRNRVFKLAQKLV